MISNHEYARTRHRWLDFLEQLQSLCHQLRKEKGRSRDVTTRTSKAPSEARCNEVTAHRLHDRNRCCHAPGGKSSSAIRFGCCARAASGHAAAPPSSDMNSRRFIQLARPRG